MWIAGAVHARRHSYEQFIPRPAQCPVRHPRVRVKLLTLRGIWRDRRARNSFYCESSCGVHLDSLLAHLEANHPGLSAFVKSIIGSPSLHIDAVLRARLKVPLGKAQRIIHLL